MGPHAAPRPNLVAFARGEFADATEDLPESTAELASSARYENRAFAGGARVLAFHFHIGPDPRSPERYLPCCRFLMVKRKPS
jgi:hypothetical protein